MTAVSDTKYNILCPSGFYLNYRKRFHFEPPLTSDKCDYETGKWASAPVYCVGKFNLNHIDNLGLIAVAGTTNSSLNLEPEVVD